MSSARGIDVSHHQGAVDWAAVAADGIEFAYCKVTESDYYVDSQWTANRAGARAHGVKLGGYHFGRMNADPGSCARFFLQHLGWQAGDLPPALDSESADGYAPSHCHAWVHQFRAALEMNAAQYTGNWFWTPSVIGAQCSECTPRPLWLGPNAPMPPTWPYLTISQTYNAVVAGVAGPCDFNTIEHGTLADLISLANGGASPGPDTEPTPTEKDFLDMINYAVIFPRIANGDIYEADLLSGTYYKVADPAALNARRIALKNAGIPFKDVTPVTGLERYGIEIKKRGLL